jgi:hypothetical protein
VLGPADEIEQPPAGDEVVHKMPAGAHPGLAAELELELGDPFGRNQPAIGDTTGKGRLLRAK